MASNTISADFVFPLKAHDVESEVIRHALAGMINGSFTHSMYVTLWTEIKSLPKIKSQF